jgi:YaiO family outer membrane protein
MNITQNSIKDIASEQNLQDKIKEIEEFSINGQLSNAIVLAKEILNKYPENKDLNLLYAKLLFWSHNPDQAKETIENYKIYDQVLYQKIYIAWAVEILQNTTDISQKLQFIDTLKPFAQESYDIRWIAITLNIEKKRLKTALHLAEALVQKYPESREALERLAALLFWNGYYQNSLENYHKLNKQYGKEYQQQISKLETIIQGKQKQKKASVKMKTDSSKILPVTTASTKPKRPLIEPRDMDKRHLSKYMTGIGFQKALYSDDRYKDLTRYVEMTLPIDEYTLYLKVQDTTRYGLNDKKILGELYPKLPEPQWGYLSFSYTPQADFLSEYSIGWHHFYGWENWQFGLGYEFSKYDTQNINLLSAEYSYYFNEFLFGRQVAYYVPDTHSWACLNQLKYQTPEHLEWYIDYIISRSNEEISDTNFLMGTDINHIKIGGEYPIGDRYTIGGNLGNEWLKDEKNTYTRSYFEFFIRIYW